MSGKVFQIIVVIALVAAALLVVKPIVMAKEVALADQKALHQYRLAEHYGEVPQQSVSSQLMHLYQMGERYGESAEPVISPQLMHLYQMSERYGESAEPVISSQLIHLYQMGERYGETPYTATGVTDPVVLKELAQVRQATVKYQDVNVALADGFIRTPNCVQDPKLGGMGIHFINPARLKDPAVNILQPEILLYSETAGGMKLLGVEYMFAIGAPDTHVPNPAPPSPIIFGRSLDGPMEQHEPGQPPHYDLHVWVWKANPAGIFAPFNPNVSCQ